MQHMLEMATISVWEINQVYNSMVLDYLQDSN